MVFLDVVDDLFLMVLKLGIWFWGMYDDECFFLCLVRRLVCINFCLYCCFIVLLVFCVFCINGLNVYLVYCNERFFWVDLRFWLVIGDGVYV